MLMPSRFQSVGGSVANEAQRILAEREIRRRQELMDSVMINRENRNDEVQREQVQSLVQQRDVMNQSREMDMAVETAKVTAPGQQVTPGIRSRLGPLAEVLVSEAGPAEGAETDDTMNTDARFRGTPDQLLAAEKERNDVAAAAKPVVKAEPSKGAAIQEYEYYKAEEVAAGRTPVSFDEYQARDANRKRPAAINPQIQQARNSRRTGQISDQFDRNPIVRRMNIVAEGYDFARSLPDDSTSAADDQALIYAFAKAMDPESVVREGEYATVQKYAQSWVQNFGFNAQRVISNTEFLTPEARRKMKDTIGTKYAAARKPYDNYRKEVARKIDLETGRDDGDDHLTRYESAYPDVPTSRGVGNVAPATGAAPVAGAKPVIRWGKDASGKPVRLQ